MKLLKTCCGHAESMDVLYDSYTKKFTKADKGLKYVRQKVEFCDYCGEKLELSEEIKKNHYKLTGESL